MPMRRASILLLVLTLAGVIATAGPVGAAPRGDTNPVPIPGGIQIPDGPLIHVFAPGPEDAGFMGENVDPSVITNFRGFSALAYIGGTATDAAGNTYDMEVDIRVYQGEYVAADGTHHRGTFGFV